MGKEQGSEALTPQAAARISNGLLSIQALEADALDELSTVRAKVRIVFGEESEEFARIKGLEAALRGAHYLAETELSHWLSFGNPSL